MGKIKESLYESTKRMCEQDVFFQDYAIFLKVMAAILFVDADNRLKNDMACFKGVKKPKTEDYVNVLACGDLFRGTQQMNQLVSFFKWFIEQEAPNEDTGTMWCDFSFMLDKWNEYARENGAANA